MIYKSYTKNYQLHIQTRDDYIKSNQKIFNTFSSIQNKMNSFYEIKDIYCEINCILINKENKPLYFDDDHLNLTGAQLMVPLFNKIFNDLYKKKEEK